MRVAKHPVLGDEKPCNKVTIWVDGSPIEAIEGEPIAAALYAAGIRTLRRTRKGHEPRGYFCGIGRCTDCMMIVDGAPNTRTCVTPCKDGMQVETQGSARERKEQQDA